MVKHLLKCKRCNEYRLYNPQLKCNKCGGDLISSRPPKFSPIDKYSKYRREYFKEEMKDRFEDIKD